MVDGLIDAGNDGVVVTGTTGESPVLTETERMALYREALRAADGRARVIAGTGGYNTSESVHLSRAAADVGVDGLLQVTPYYNKPPQPGLFRHFETIAAATPLPNILYNVPGRTSCNLAADTVAQLSAINNIIGIKEASATSSRSPRSGARRRTTSRSTAAMTRTRTSSWRWAAWAW